MRRVHLLILAGMVAFIPSIAEAAKCTVATNNFAFGNYNPLNPAPTNVTGTNLITVQCEGNGSMTVDLSTGGSTSYFPRAMTGVTDTLTYNFYTAASLGTVWGDGTGGTGHIVQTFTHNSTTSFNVYGQITALQNVAPGNYTDTITVTVTF